jgi:hypothetical protein
MDKSHAGRMRPSHVARDLLSSSSTSPDEEPQLTSRPRWRSSTKTRTTSRGAQRFARPGDPDANYVQTWAILRALTEFPHHDLADALMVIVDRSVYRERPMGIRAPADAARIGRRRSQSDPEAGHGRDDERTTRLVSPRSNPRRLGSRDATDSLLRGLSTTTRSTASGRPLAGARLLQQPGGYCSPDLRPGLCARGDLRGCVDDLADALRLVEARDVASEYSPPNSTATGRKRRIAERILLHLAAGRRCEPSTDERS